MKKLIFFLCLMLPLLLISQQNNAERYVQKEQKENVFVRDKNAQTPDYWPSSYPNEMDQGQFYDEAEENYHQSPINQQVDPHQINSSRIERYGENYGEGAVKKPNSKIVPPNPIELPDIKVPKVNLPEVDIPDFNWPSFGSWEFWKFFFLILIIIAVVLGAYLLIRNYRPSDAKVKMEIDDEWNPTLITKTELEIKLEKAELSDDYRECVRIHFMFILKALIDQEIIDWQLEKTNYEYLLEVRKNKGYDDFENCVRIYDLVWYGEYQISQDAYQQLKPTLENYYQSLNPAKP